MLSEARFYRFAREERLFCATLAHLLMQKGPNLQTFIDLINARLPGHPQIQTDRPDEAQIYLEFTFLRDHWNRLGTNNDAKRGRIFELISKVEGLRRYTSESFPIGIPEFNEYFVGERGRRIEYDIVYPGQWSVGALRTRFGADREVFRDFCKFKWAFNIKPDMVILLPGSPPLSIEAKLESKEGWYPAAFGERAIFDELFGVEKGRVGQIKLQRFMFEVLLGDPCRLVLIARTRQPETKVDAFLTWREVFAALDFSSSIPHVHRLVEENSHLRLPQVRQGAAGQA